MTSELNEEFMNTTPGGAQLSASFATYAQGIKDAYDQVQALLDQHTAKTNRQAVNALEAIVESQQKMLVRMRTLV